MRSFLSLLQTMRPRNGRIIAEDGQGVNIADIERFREANSITRRVVEGDAVRFSARRRAVDQDVYWIGVDVPSGKALIVIDDFIKLTENQYDLDTFRAPDGFSGGTDAVKACLCELADPSAMQSTVSLDVTPANTDTHVLRFEDFIDSGTSIGAARAAPTSGGEESVHVLTESTLLRITRINAGQPYDLAYRLLAWEVSNT